MKVFHARAPAASASPVLGAIANGLFRRRWLLPLAVAVALAMLMLLSPDVRGWTHQAAWATAFSSAQTWVALILFFTVVWALYQWLRVSLVRLHRNQDRLLPFVAGLLLLVLAVNAFPIVVYIRAFDDAGLAPAAVAVASLLLANAMLYFFLNRFLHMVWREIHKLYATSAVYKGATPIGYAHEMVYWDLLNTLKPLYLYLFSFTLFTDFLLQHRRVDLSGEGANELSMGIIGQVFEIISHEGWTAEVAVSLVVLWLLVWPQRELLDHLARRWERSRHLGGA